MSIPNYEAFMLPLLKISSDGHPHHIRDAAELAADVLGISQSEREQLLPSGKKLIYYDRAQWAKSYLKQAGLIESVGRGLFAITVRGQEVLRSNPFAINREYLMQFPEFRDFLNRGRLSVDTLNHNSADELISDRTPEELIEAVIAEFRKSLADELLEYVMSASPAFFERLVVELLQSMGYGGAFGTGKSVGRTDDGGIDGYIQEDKLGLDTIYIQAKRWQRDSSVGRPEVQAFAGSLMGVGATKGVFIATCRFSQKAIDYARALSNLKVVLIDGEQLAQLMIEHNVGVSTERTFVLKKVDKDYFEPL